jgi:hypothetical protein
VGGLTDYSCACSESWIRIIERKHHVLVRVDFFAYWRTGKNLLTSEFAPIHNVSLFPANMEFRSLKFPRALEAKLPTEYHENNLRMGGHELQAGHFPQSPKRTIALG